MVRSLLGSAAALSVLALAGACTPVRDHHGFLADQPNAINVQVGVDTQTTVRERLGSPSTTAVLEGQAGSSAQTTWYYVSVVQERFAAYNPRTVERQVVAIRFDGAQTVSAVDRYGIERGQVITYNEDRTPTRGRELGIVEQIFGNIGRGSPLPTSDQQQGGGGSRR